MSKVNFFELIKLADPKDAVLLSVDHQSGLLNTVADIDKAKLRNNLEALCKAAALLKIPVISTASVPEGPNGPQLSEVKEFASDQTYVERKGEINAWDNEDFVNEIRKTGRKTLIIAGIWTSVCVAFPAISAIANGFKVYSVNDASGDISNAASNLAVTRMAQAGVITVSTNAIIAELQKTWNRDDAQEFAQLYSKIVPSYGAVVESFFAAQKK